MNVLHLMLIFYNLTINVKIEQENLSAKKRIKFFFFPFEHVSVVVKYRQYYHKSGEKSIKIQFNTQDILLS